MCADSVPFWVESKITNNNRDIVPFDYGARNYADCRFGEEIG